MRFISIGTDMVSSVISLQKPRPWYMCADEGSNKAKDNAITLKELFGRDKTLAVFGVPAPFTGTCTRELFDRPSGSKSLRRPVETSGG